MKSKGLVSLSQYLATNLTLYKQYFKRCGHCVICQQHTSDIQLLCAHCLEVFPRFDLIKLDGDLLNRPEIYNLFKRYPFSHLISVAPYQLPLSTWISQYKYHKNIGLRTLLSQLVDLQLNDLQRIDTFAKPDVVIPVPIHIKKWRQRGFNQSDIIAQTVANFFNVPLIKDSVIRTKHSKSQVSQSGTARRKNLTNSFKVEASHTIENKRVWLIDDVVTTGATAGEISRHLKAANAGAITLFTMAVSC